ncbi:hypothetical protein ACIRRI_32690 [Streptomyces mirabilis]|uniref:hypothetical protein n=1 Tax=Streptomyces mirabilis TaxID=68239 RepID=UPI0037F50CAF
MNQPAGEVRNNEYCSKDVWLVLTRTVAYDGSACVIAGASDFDLDDLNLVRHRFPGRRAPSTVT